MNYLAHAYLSFEHPELLVGNLIGDFVKGKQKEKYPENIKKGIELHWRIDSYTDAHPIIIETKKVFHDAVRLYDGAFLDIANDYFLAHDVAFIPPKGWENFAQETYRTVHRFLPQLPLPFHEMFDHMEKNDWLSNYQHKWQIEKSFAGLIRRAKYLEIAVAPVYQVFEEKQAYLQLQFDAFFPQLVDFVKNKNGENR